MRTPYGQLSRDELDKVDSRMTRWKVYSMPWNCILRKQRFDHITSDLRDQLHWLPFQQRIEYNACAGVQGLTSGSRATSLKCAHRCLHLSIEVISVLQRISTLYYSTSFQNNEICTKKIRCSWFDAVYSSLSSTVRVTHRRHCLSFMYS